MLVVGGRCAGWSLSPAATAFVCTLRRHDTTHFPESRCRAHIRALTQQHQAWRLWLCSLPSSAWWFCGGLTPAFRAFAPPPHPPFTPPRGSPGMQHVAAIEKFDSKMWDKLIALNLTAGFQLTKAVLPAMVVNGYGRVINIASGTSPTGRMHNHTLLLMGAASTLPACYLLQCIGVSSYWFRVLSSACAPTTFLSFSGCSARLGWLHAQVGVRGEQARHRRLH